MTATTVSKPAPALTKAGPLAALGLLLAAVVVVAGNVNVSKGQNGGAGPAIFTGILCLVLAAVLFGVVVPRAKRVEASTLTLGIVSLVSLVVFWSGVTPVLAAATWAVAARTTDLGGKANTGRWLAAASGLLAVGWTIVTSLFL
ncbi:MAG: hypothetical protein ACRDV3_15105 [Acidothermaceae bacterium]